MREAMYGYLTADIPGTGGVIKERPEDFRVTEIPRYLPCGEGEHVYLHFEKRGVTTLDAIRRVSRTLHVSERDIGYAGMKDAQGITRQTISVPRVEPEALLALDLPGIRPLSARRHTNKLKLGHTAGNSFEIVVRGVAADALERTNEVLDVLRRRGVPNYFGMQRYGAQRNSHLIGLAWLTGEYRKVVDTLVGTSESVRDERWREAIDAYRRGDIEESFRLFPPHCRTERDVLSRLLQNPEGFGRAISVINPRLKMLYFSAVQSSLFDGVVAARLPSIDTVMAGDLAWKHENGACFMVQDPSAEAGRARNMEISATGPMFGRKMKLPEGVPLEIESGVLADHALPLDRLTASPDWRYDGERRPLRVPLPAPEATVEGTALTLGFSLPSGSYATSVLREIMKTEDL